MRERGGSADTRLRPLRSPVVPFLAVAMLAPVVAVTLPGANRPEAIAALAITAVLGLAAAAVPWRRLPPAAAAVVPLAYFIVIALLRDSDGGGSSEWTPLVLLPVVWLGLRGHRGPPAAALGVLAVTFVTPIVALGAPEYPDREWLRTAVWLTVAAAAGLTIRSLVGAARRAAGQAREHLAVAQAADSRYRQALEITPVGVATLDLDGRYLTVNRAFCDLVGRDEGALVGRLFQDVTHPEDGLEGQRLAGELIAGTRRSFTLEKRYLRPDGGEAWGLLSCTLIFAADGSPHQFLCFAQDITGRRQREREAAEEAADLARVISVAHAVAGQGDARQAICTGTLDVAGADFVVLFEPDERADLVATGRAGRLAETPVIPAPHQASGVRLAFTSGERVFVPDALGDPRVSRRLVDETGTASILFEPIVRGSETVGVLATAWREPVAATSERLLSLITLLAAEAAIGLEREDLVQMLDRAARTDELTGIPNRRAWREALEREAARVRRDGQPLSMALLDLDHYKRSNDRYGHQAGDRLLKEAAAAWRDELRLVDVLARYGGEEFAVLMTDCTLDRAVEIIERLRAATPADQTVSAGVACWRPGSETLEELLTRADGALYEAKAAGRDKARASS